MAAHGVGDKLQPVALLHDASPGDGEKPGGGDFPFRALVSERDFAPNHSVPQSALRAVVGRLDIGIIQKCEQPVAMLEHRCRQYPHFLVLTVEVLPAELEKALLQRNRFPDQLGPVQFIAPKPMPQPKQLRRLRQRVAAEPFGVGRAAKFLNSQQIPLQMSPTELGVTLVILQVCPESVTAQNPRKHGAQQMDEDGGTARGGHREEDEGTGHQRPQPPSFPHAAPAGFIAVQHRLARQLPLQLLAGLRQRLAGFLN